MPRVRLLLFTNSSGDQFRYYSSELAGVITEWEEVTDEELEWLTTHIRKLEAPYGLHYVLVVEDLATTKYHIDSIRQFVEEEKTKQEAEENKRKERARKTAETKRKNKEEKERKLLEQLKEKYGT
jgi:L-lactate utilization protein LutC